MFQIPPTTLKRCGLLAIVAFSVVHVNGADELPRPRLWNVLPPWEALGSPKQLPLQVPACDEHIGSTEAITDPRLLQKAVGIEVDREGKLRLVLASLGTELGHRVTSRLEVGGEEAWVGTEDGLFIRRGRTNEFVLHKDYGVAGPLSTRITGLARDSRGAVWVGTPLGLSVKSADGTWRHVRGREGLPVEDVTALAVDVRDDLWIGTSKGAILHRPYSQGRRWFYRQGPRYLAAGDRIKAIALAPGGVPAYFLADQGVSKIDTVPTTLLAKAQAMESRIGERHRRLGLVAACVLDNPREPRASSIEDNDNDGLWTAYHVAAQSLAYGATKSEAARLSAREGMHALYMLQNASGTPGLVARSVLPADIGRTKGPQWRPTPDGKLYWKSDTSSDEIDGHYLAFYAYFEHIARHDAAERTLCLQQLRALTDYILDHNYQLIDWTGKRTRWGFWHPEALNDDPEHYLENGLNSLQMLSFLKVAHHVTGDARYQQHYAKLIHEHGYLNNVLLSKKVFPDEDNHSDNQLGFVAWYPILQLEKTPQIRAALLGAVRRHYEVVREERSSFFTFVYATVDPNYADLAGAIEDLRQIPTDRRLWRQENAHRADVIFGPRRNRFNERVLLHVLPADERLFEKWNADPLVPDAGGDGRVEDDGAAFLLPYWMGRYHGFIAESSH